MNIVVLANDENWEAINKNTADINFVRVNTIEQFLAEKNIDVYFNLMENSSAQNYKEIEGPIFINSVTNTLKQINAPKNLIRINGWAGFIEKELWELAGHITPSIENILTALGKKHIALPDEPGFVTARTIAMVINEAYFALEDNVSSENEIDIAMKLGTNYPYGPFEWATRIGLKNIYELLLQLSKADERYTISTNIKEKLNF